jgi:hypothetical protein
MGAKADADNTAPANNDIVEEDIFDSDEYDNNVENFGPAKVETESDDVGTGAIIASIHVDDAQNDDELVVHVAAMATSKPSDDVTVAQQLMQSVREEYELRGSGIKPQTIGRTNKQIQANSTKEWASNSNVKPAHPGQGGKSPVEPSTLTPPIQAPKTPTTGGLVPEMETTTPIHTSAAPCTAAEFYMSMDRIMAKFSETISAKLHKTIDWEA